MSAKMEEGCIFHQAKAHLLSLEEEEDVLQTRAIAIFSNKVITIFPNYWRQTLLRKKRVLYT